MAGEGGWKDHPLSARLLKEPHRFSFYRIVYLLQHLVPEAAPVGAQGPPEREVVRFRADLSMGFSSSDVTTLTVKDGESEEIPRFELTTTFMGLFGPASPLPTHFTEELLQDEEGRDVRRAFLDLFHHRMMSLLYRVWEKYRFGIRFRPGGIDAISRLFLQLSGLGLPPKADAHIPPIRLLAYAGLWTQRTRPASALRGILADYFAGTEVEIEQFAGRWLEIPESEQNRLGGARSRLGEDMNLGSRIFDRGASFRVRLDHLGIEDYLDFLPPGRKTEELEEIVDQFNSDGLDYEVKLWLRREEIPSLKLGAPAARLGWATWLGKAPEANQSLSYKMKGRSHGER
ncbi:MAG TPA: type VI secretion system baseplate subunit TssG [Planctomycetota bacterium]|nr:type VI secretion system baseplate subunit TssG [Planctomycetota bacterium]